MVFPVCAPAQCRGEDFSQPKYLPIVIIGGHGILIQGMPIVIPHHDFECLPGLKRMVSNLSLDKLGIGWL